MTTQQLVTLVARKRSTATLDIKNRLIAFFSAHGVNFQVDDHPNSLQGIVNPSSVKIVSIDDVKTGLLVSIGGDGAILRLVPHAMRYQLPIVAINLGRVGFLADIPADRFSDLLSVIHGQYAEEMRSTLSLSVHYQDTEIATDVALNEISLSTHTPGRIIHIDAAWESSRSTYHADGILVASPTGSTGYSLSANGPIVHPSTDTHIITPVCPSPKSCHPLVLPATFDIKLSVPVNSMRNADVCCDGRFVCTATAGYQLVIRKHSRQLRLWHPTNYDFIQMLGLKLQQGDMPHHASEN